MKRSLPASYSPIAARGSIALTIMRLLIELELDLVGGAGEGGVRPSRCRRSGNRGRRCPARRRTGPARPPPRPAAAWSRPAAARCRSRSLRRRPWPAAASPPPRRRSDRRQSAPCRSAAPAAAGFFRSEPSLLLNGSADCSVPYGLEVRAGVDAEHARHCLRRRGADRLDAAVRERAAHDEGMGLAGQVDVVGVAALAAQQLGVFGARHRLADAEAGSVGRVLNVHGDVAPG